MGVRITLKVKVREEPTGKGKLRMSVSCYLNQLPLLDSRGSLKQFEGSNQQIYGVPTNPVGLLSWVAINVCPEATEKDTEAASVKN